MSSLKKNLYPIVDSCITPKTWIQEVRGFAITPNWLLTGPLLFPIGISNLMATKNLEFRFPKALDKIPENNDVPICNTELFI